MSTTYSILHHYRQHQDFELARRALRNPARNAAPAVFSASLDPDNADVLPLLVTVLSDVLDAHTGSWIRIWMEDVDQPGVAEAVAKTLEHIAGGRFALGAKERRNPQRVEQALLELAAWWDERRASRRSSRASTPKDPGPRESVDVQREFDELRPEVYELLRDFLHLDAQSQRTIEHRVLTNAMSIWRRFAPGDHRLDRALEVCERHLAGKASADELSRAWHLASRCTQEADALSGWNPVHRTWMFPDANAASYVAHGVMGLCKGDEHRYPVEGLNLARIALLHTGANLPRVRDELAWQHQMVMRARRGAPSSGASNSGGYERRIAYRTSTQASSSQQ